MNTSILKTLHRDVMFALNVQSSCTLRDRYFTSPKFFSRNRKLPFAKTLAIMLRNDKRNLSMAMETFFLDILHPKEGAIPETIPTASALCQQRAKIKPDFFSDWLRQTAVNFYQDVAPKLWHGMVLCAFDGSRVKVPDTPALKEKYGFNPSRINTEKPLSMVCILCDLLNGIVMDAAIGTARTAEQRLAYGMLERDVSHPYPLLVLGDRAYTSFRVMYTISSAGNYFIIRASHTRTNSIKAFLSSEKQEDMIDITCSKKSHSEMVQAGHSLPSDASMSVRAIKYPLPNGETEILLTNLPANDFPASMVGSLYPLRWGVETDYGYLKNEEQIEVSPGLSDTCFLQGIYIALILFSLTSIISLLDEDHLAKYNNCNDRKYTMKINRNDCWTEMQRLFPLGILDVHRLQWIVMELATLFARHLIPIRPGRHYRRRLLGTGKYITFSNYRRAI